MCGDSGDSGDPTTLENTRKHEPFHVLSSAWANFDARKHSTVRCFRTFGHPSALHERLQVLETTNLFTHIRVFA